MKPIVDWRTQRRVGTVLMDGALNRRSGKKTRDEANRKTIGDRGTTAEPDTAPTPTYPWLLEIPLNGAERFQQNAQNQSILIRRSVAAPSPPESMFSRWSAKFPGTGVFLVPFTRRPGYHSCLIPSNVDSRLVPRKERAVFDHAGHPAWPMLRSFRWFSETVWKSMSVQETVHGCH